MQPAERSALPLKPYKPLKHPFILLAWVDSCGGSRVFDAHSGSGV